MDELRKNQDVVIKTRNSGKFTALVLDYEQDRVLLQVENENIEKASKLNELDDIIVYVNTNFGQKHMLSCVLSSLNKKKLLVIENSRLIDGKQRREFARVASKIEFKILLNGEFYNAVSCDISGNSISFTSSEHKFQINDSIVLGLKFANSRQEVNVSGIISKVYQDRYVAKYININPYAQSKIIKFVNDEMTKK